MSDITAISPRESEVLDSVVKHGVYKLVASDLGISRKTVEVHMSRIMRKTAIRNGLLLAVWWDRQKRAPV